MTHTFQLYIDGKWIDAEYCETRPVVNPVDGSAIDDAPCATKADSDQAASAAGRIFPSWAALPAIERQVYLRHAGQIIADRQEDIARMMVRDHGKPLHEARGEAGGIPETLEWFGEEGRCVYGRIMPSQDQVTKFIAEKINV